jgi:hypothetical protein
MFIHSNVVSFMSRYREVFTKPVVIGRRWLWERVRRSGVLVKFDGNFDETEVLISAEKFGGW